MYWPWAITFSLYLVSCWCVGLFGLPGNWLMLGGLVGFAYAFPANLGPGIGWGTVAVCAGLIIGGEIIETFAGAAGLAKGGSKRAAILATVGSLIGGLFGVGIAGPVGILLFAAVGAMGGAVVGELWKGRDQRLTWELGKLAFWGRLFGSVAKAILGSLVIGVATIAAWWNWNPWQ